MKVIAGLMIAGVLAGVAAPAYAGSTAPAPSATPLGDTLSLELSPEWGAGTGNPYKDSYAKIGFSHNLGNGFALGVSLQETITDPKQYPAYSSAFQPEGTLGYKWKQDALTFGVSAGVGYNSALQSSSNSSSPAVGTYYLVSGTVDWKLDSKWTWNVINARYRNAFNDEWITPKVATGVTYAIDARQAVYTAVGYAWKETTGKPLAGDKINWAFGYKLGF